MSQDETVKAVMGTVDLRKGTDAASLWDTVAERVVVAGLIEGGFLTLTGTLCAGRVRLTEAGRKLAAELWA